MARLRFIRRAKELGFTLKEIGTQLSLRHDSEATRADVKREAEQKIVEIEARIRSLQRMKRTLRELAEACPGRGSTSDCPILEAVWSKNSNDDKSAGILQVGSRFGSTISADGVQFER